MGGVFRSLTAGFMVWTREMTVEDAGFERRDGVIGGGLRADLVGKAIGEVHHPDIVVDWTIALPHAPNDPGEPRAAGSAANEAARKKHTKYDAMYNMKKTLYAAALERFGHVHPETLRLLRTVATMAASRGDEFTGALAGADAEAPPGGSDRHQPSVTGVILRQMLVRLSVILQRGNAGALLSYRNACIVGRVHPVGV
jgi:hypothetical protein